MGKVIEVIDATTYKAAVCENGHIHAIELDLQQKTTTNFCNKCGKKIIIECPNCSNHIKGNCFFSALEVEYHDGGRTSEKQISRYNYESFDEYKLDSYCSHCGKPYPWTEKKLNNLKEIIELQVEVDSATREKILAEVEILYSEQNQEDSLSLIKLKLMLQKIPNNDIVKNAIGGFLSSVAFSKIFS